MEYNVSRVYFGEVAAVNDLMTLIRSMLWNITHRLGFLDLLDIILVAVIIYVLLNLTRHTRSSAVMKGLVLSSVAVLISNLLGLTSLNWIMNLVLRNGALVLVVLFQPELRKMLESMGTSTVFSNSKRKHHMTDRDRIISEIVQTMTDLSARKVGALIVLEQKTGLNDVIETGTKLESVISAPLLENIFEPNTPLHDGAVVIRDNQIMAAACIIHTLTESTGVSRALGTRHRAGIGLTETTDAVVLIVSEETGAMSVARGGELNRGVTREQLTEVLESVYEQKTPFKLMEIIRGFSKGKEEANEE